MVSDVLEERIPPAVASAASNPKSFSEMIESMFQGFLGKQNKEPTTIPFQRERDGLHIEVYTPRKHAKVIRPHGKLVGAHRLGR